MLNRSHLRLTLRVLQRGLTSSPAAVAQTLATLRRSPDLAPGSRSRIAGFAEMAALINPGRKVAAVGELLARFPGDQVLIYTEFRRSQDALEAHLNNKGMEQVMKATVAVQDKTLSITTQNPHTLQDEVRSCMIRELTPASLIVEFEKGEVFRMARAR